MKHVSADNGLIGARISGTGVAAPGTLMDALRLFWDLFGTTSSSRGRRRILIRWTTQRSGVSNYLRLIPYGSPSFSSYRLRHLGALKCPILRLVFSNYNPRRNRIALGFVNCDVRRRFSVICHPDDLEVSTRPIRMFPFIRLLRNRARNSRP